MSMSEEMGVQIEQVKIRVLPDGRVTRKDSARYLGCSEKTMAMWQLEGKGPRQVKVGGRRFCFLNELAAYARGEAGASD